MTEEQTNLDLATETTPDQQVENNPRSLTSVESDSYAARMASSGFEFTVAGSGEPFGFDVRALDGSVSYGYRYDVSAGTAVELMERICSERGC